LVSVRSGAAISMPGMMDTVLNLGINDDTVRGLALKFGDRFAMDSYRRFLHMFGTVVMDIPHHDFEEVIKEQKEKLGLKTDNELSAEDLAAIVELYKVVYIKQGKEFPTDPYAQLAASLFAVFNSWNSDRANKYRDAEGITGLLGTAVNIQAMCFGNMGATSGTGVCFTRDPNTGEHMLYGEYLINAQGEDVVAGIRTPNPIETLKDTLPEAYAELVKNVNILEKNNHDMQDIEFTIQEGKLFMLQTRSGKRTGQAAIKIALDFVKAGLATKDQAIKTVNSAHLKQLLHPQFVTTTGTEYTSQVVAKGLPASPGAAVGIVVFTAEAAEAAFAAGDQCVLVRDETSPEDVGGMWASNGVLTARGGMTSHAAVVARGWGKPCVCGCDALDVDMETLTATLRMADGKLVKVRENDWISLNGDTGEVLVGQQNLRPPSIDATGDVSEFMQWVDDRRTIKVLANADTPADAMEARKNGAEGIGLTRTEHMFFSEDRIRLVRRMILAKDPENRKQALKELGTFQKRDFEGILKAMDGLPVTVRLLDPPLHEFLPNEENMDAVIDEKFVAEVGMDDIEECKQTIARMKEMNPMLGLRGCRLGIVMPELVKMQARALIEAALDNKYLHGLDPRPEIMVPLVSTMTEFKHQAALIRSTADEVYKEREGQSIKYRLGTMIETPRAALTAGEIAAAGAEFFSYGTNDLTQMTFGFSRDDVGTYLPTYIREGILDKDPFEKVDESGVGQLIVLSMAAGRAASTNENFKAGICGEHGGDPQSVRFFSRNKMDYVSCSPFRVPIARLAAAQSAIEMDQEAARESSGIVVRYKSNLSNRRKRLYIKDRNLVNKMYAVGKGKSQKKKNVAE
jgi:pyruvate,orthophosphate dikinase